MTAELWAIPALLLLLLVIGLIALLRGRPRPPAPRSSRLGVSTRPPRQAAATRPSVPAGASRLPPYPQPGSPYPPRQAGSPRGPMPVPRARARADDDDTADTEPDNLNTRREAATEALKLARQRAAADTARMEAMRQQRSASTPPVVTPLRRPPPPAWQPRPPPPANTRPGGLAPAPALPPAPLPPLARSPLPVAPAAVPVAAPVAMPLPALPPAPLQPPVQPQLQPPIQPPSQAQAPPPPTVLVVDDSKVVRVKTSRLLEKHHYRVMLADDGLTALQALATHWPDLVITDVEMPGLDGFGLTQQLRGLPRGHATPVIMITSANDRHREEATRAGVSVLLGKPYHEEQLLAEVEKALGPMGRPAPAGLTLQ